MAKNKIVKIDLYFETTDIFGKRVRTTTSYWNKIFSIKHKELIISKTEVIKTLQKPDEVRISI